MQNINHWQSHAALNSFRVNGNICRKTEALTDIEMCEIVINMHKDQPNAH